MQFDPVTWAGVMRRSGDWKGSHKSCPYRGGRGLHAGARVAVAIRPVDRILTERERTQGARTGPPRDRQPAQTRAQNRYPYGQLTQGQRDAESDAEYGAYGTFAGTGLGTRDLVGASGLRA